MNKRNIRLSIGAVITLSATVALGSANAHAATSPTLGAAGSYSVLGHTTVTNTGPMTMPGDLGISIGGAPTGFPPGIVGPPGTVRNTGDSLAAQNANTAAFLALSAAPNVACSGQDYGAVTQELEGLSLVPGVYCADAFQLSGTLTLDAQGDPNAVWIFRTLLSTLNTSMGTTNNANVLFLNGVGSPCNVWWKVASSASIGTGSAFIGNILALTSISMDTGATLNGRLLTQTGAVTLDANTITGSTCLTTPVYLTTVTPKLPNTGTQPQVDGTLLIIPAVAGLVLLTLVVIRKKRSI